MDLIGHLETLYKKLRQSSAQGVPRTPAVLLHEAQPYLVSLAIHCANSASHS